MLLFSVGQSAQVAEDPVLGVLPDGAGVQDHHVRLLGLVDEGKAAVLKHPHQLLAVSHVLLTAEGVHAGPGVSLALGEHGSKPVREFPLAAKVLRRNLYRLSFQM